MSDDGRRTREGRDPLTPRGSLGRGAQDGARSPYYPEHGEPLRAPWDPVESVPGRRRSVPGGRDHLPRQTAFGRFVSTWGWRAYAIPVLIVLTALVLADVVRDPTGGVVQEPPAATTEAVPQFAPGPVSESGTLPEGGDYTEDGRDEFRLVSGGTDRVGAADAELFVYTVEIEQGIDTTEFGGDESIARMVDATLGNPQSWTADGTVAFRRVAADGDEPDFRVSLTTPMTVREHCGYDIEVETSCFQPKDERVYLNLARWVRGARPFQGDIGSYRQYLVNHEVGHAIGNPRHEPCDDDGGLAPVMMQQTFGVANREIFQLDPQGVVPDDSKVCRYNPWPYPGGRPPGQR